MNRYLHAIRPPLDVPDVATFSYPDLESTVKNNYKSKFESADEIFERYDADDEENLDLRLSHEYLLISALKLQEAGSNEDRELWSRRYTAASVEVFGQPDKSQVAMIAAAELPRFVQTAQTAQSDANDRLVEIYTELSELYDGTSSQADHQAVLAEVRKYLQLSYPQALAVLSGDDDKILSFVEIFKYFSEALEAMHWSGWRVVSNATAQMSVSPIKRTINIGRFIPDMKLRRVRALFSHEVLTHAQRAHNGGKIDINLSYGLPGYLTAEEGLGVVLESAVDGALPNRVADRYVDIALALGIDDVQPMTRPELFKLTITRMLMRLGSMAEYVDRSVMRRVAWQHVNRIYRGSLGNQFIGVFTRDIAYYRGFQGMIKYLERYREAGLDSALEFVLSGKFDPTRPSHRLYVHKRQFNIKTNLPGLAR